MSARHQAEALLAAGVPAMDVQVLSHRGSVPREAGTHMLVTRDAVLGTIGGGHLELTAIAQARQWLATGDTAPHDAEFALGPSLGQCCGGALTLRTQRLGDVVLAAWPDSAPRFFLQLY